MPLRLNHLQEKAGVNVQNVTDTLHFLVQEGCIPQDQLVSFQIELDWIQYKNNFREPVLLAETHNGHAGGAPVSELRIDTRQVEPGVGVLGSWRARTSFPTFTPLNRHSYGLVVAASGAARRARRVRPYSGRATHGVQAGPSVAPRGR